MALDWLKMVIGLVEKGVLDLLKTLSDGFMKNRRGNFRKCVNGCYKYIIK